MGQRGGNEREREAPAGPDSILPPVKAYAPIARREARAPAAFNPTPKNSFMKIALSFPGCHGRGGVERLLLETANFLAARGHEVHVYASEWDADALHAGITCHRVRSATGPSLLRLMTYTRQCRVEMERFRPKPDVHGAFGVISPTGGVVNVQSVHRAWLDVSRRLRSFKGRFRQACNLSHPYILALERNYFGARNYTKLVAPTRQVKSDLMRWYDVPEEDIAIVRNGYAADRLNFNQSRQLRPKMRFELGYGESDTVVLFVANELERKGFGPLLRAIAALKNPRLHLLAVVGRVRPDSYAGEIRRLGLTNRVKFTGAKRDLAPYYAAADVFALPTQYEPWGLVIVEALACGTRVITSRLAGAAVAVGEGKTGELLDDPTDVNEIAEKLRHVCGNGHLDREAVAGSVAAFRWQNVLMDYERVLMDCALKPVVYRSHF